MTTMRHLHPRYSITAANQYTKTVNRRFLADYDAGKHTRQWSEEIFISFTGYQLKNPWKNKIVVIVSNYSTPTYRSRINKPILYLYRHSMKPIFLP